MTGTEKTHLLEPAAEPHQFAALPFRTLSTGAIEILLITSISSGRWIIPKGWPIEGLPPHLSAAREAYEEAGVVGYAFEQPLGRFAYLKRMDKNFVPLTVDVFPMMVAQQLEQWPEMTKRQTRWYGSEVAAQVVSEPEIARFIPMLKSLLAASH